MNIIPILLVALATIVCTHCQQGDNETFGDEAHETFDDEIPDDSFCVPGNFIADFYEDVTSRAGKSYHDVFDVYSMYEYEDGERYLFDYSYGQVYTKRPDGTCEIRNDPNGQLSPATVFDDSILEVMEYLEDGVRTTYNYYADTIRLRYTLDGECTPYFYSIYYNDELRVAYTYSNHKTGGQVDEELGPLRDMVEEMEDSNCTVVDQDAY